ncbi:class I SAM-dependent methyltransferase [Rhodocytophaga rosea]|uniref:Class I SAM-dependent methyltransferase n=1 Tax=Rhodocytophaga rosea TaxID=2704465 RepID=A0A6C0GCM2_9BACT|nr:class I SAM-dependent methyltransferase [Rhodocytophaga rosea]QHT65647.1 class I SAM-dependent methyltransferase [Rhodocytophaga rosea]
MPLLSKRNEMAVNFDTIAYFYDQLSKVVFGKALQQSQWCTLPFIPVQATVLILGGGSGWYLKSLLQERQVKKIVYVEASAAMLRLSQQNIASVSCSTEIEFRLGTEKSIRYDEKFDVVITHFVLDLFPEPQVNSMIHLLYPALHQNGIWLCSDFELSGQQAGQWWKKSLISAMYIFFRWVSKVKARVLPDIHGLLVSCHLHCQYEATFYRGLIAARVYRKGDKSAVLKSES